MVRPTYVDHNGLRRGAWSQEEDEKLKAYVLRFGHWNWKLLPRYAGLARCGKSCRLRWINYLQPGVKRGGYTKEEEDLIAKLHRELGNKWSAIAARLPGRTDSEIKNYWHTNVKKEKKKNKENRQNIESGHQVHESSPEQQYGEATSCEYHQNALPDTSPTKREHDSDLFSSRCNMGSLDESEEEMSENYEVSTAIKMSISGPSSTWALKQGMSCGDGIPSSSDVICEFHENFWTEPFLVDASNYPQHPSYAAASVDDSWLSYSDDYRVFSSFSSEHDAMTWV